MRSSLSTKAALPILATISVFVLTARAAVPVSARVGPGAFTYQGELKDDGGGVTAEDARFNFRLWDAESTGHMP